MLDWITDDKRTYSRLGKEVFGNRIASHVRVSSQAPRNAANPLFAINHTFALARDMVSRLVRRSWAASKKHEALNRHLWCFIAWRNYVRPVTNDFPRSTPAMELGVAKKMYSAVDLLRWRWPAMMLDLQH